jgi:hypothetical protein
VLARRDPTQRNAEAIRHRGRGAFSVAGNTILHDSRFRR